MGERFDYIMSLPELKDGVVEEYDQNFETGKYKLTGLRSKHFVRCSSELFGGLVSELQNNKNTSYITHVNELIKDGYIPEYLSVLIKDGGVLEGNIREVVSSRILNYFGVPTTYETLARGSGNQAVNHYVLSADFIGSPIDEFYTLDELGIMVYNTPLENIVTDMNKLLNTFYRSRRLFNFGAIDRSQFDVQKEQVIEDFLYGYIVRRYVLDNRDLHGDNIGVIIRKDDLSISLAPNYDFEQTLEHIAIIDDTSTIDNIKFVRFMYPHIFAKFLNKLKDFRETKSTSGKPLYEEIIDNAVSNDYMSQSIKEACEYNIQKALDVCNYISTQMPLSSGRI